MAGKSCRALATLFSHEVEQLRVMGDNKVCGQRNVLDILMIYILFQGFHTAFKIEKECLKIFMYFIWCPDKTYRYEMYRYETYRYITYRSERYRL